MIPYFDMSNVGVPCFKEDQNTIFESENKLNANLFYITKNFECPLYLSGSLRNCSDNWLLSVFYILNIYKWT